MKKTVMVIGLLLAIVCGVFAQVSVAGQTLYYQYLYSVDSETEVRTIKALPYPFFADDQNTTTNKGFITFTRNSCYESNAQGIAWGRSTGKTPLAYQGEQNNMPVFYVYNVGLTKDTKDEYYFYFSKDFKRLNVISLSDYFQKLGNPPTLIQEEIVRNRTIHVYEQTTPASPKPQETQPAAPDRMW